MLAGIAICVLAIFTSGLFDEIPEEMQIFHQPTARARVLATDNSDLWEDAYVENLYIGTQMVTAEILDGAHAGTTIEFENVLRLEFHHFATEGMEILVYPQEFDGQLITLHLAGHSRAVMMYVIMGLLVLILILVGGKTGFYSSVSLLFVIVLILFYMIPAIMRGGSPIWAAVLTAALTTVLNVFLISDISVKSLAAVLGTLAGVVTAGILGMVAGGVAHISGLHMPNADDIIFLSRGLIRIRDLFVAGIIIAALGAVLDVAVSVASVIFEVRETSGNLGMKRLYQSGMNVGRDIMGTTSNTLILAFAGSSLTVMVSIALSQLPYIRIINMSMLAVEVIQGVTASIGLILTIPITALLAAFFATQNKDKPQKK